MCTALDQQFGVAEGSTCQGHDHQIEQPGWLDWQVWRQVDGGEYYCSSKLLSWQSWHPHASHQLGWQRFDVLIGLTLAKLVSMFSDALVYFFLPFNFCQQSIGLTWWLVQLWQSWQPHKPQWHPGPILHAVIQCPLPRLVTVYCPTNAAVSSCEKRTGFVAWGCTRREPPIGIISWKCFLNQKIQLSIDPYIYRWHWEPHGRIYKRGTSWCYCHQYTFFLFYVEFILYLSKGAISSRG